MSRNEISAQEREWRSRLSQLIHGKPLVRATVNVRGVTCGKAGCRCARGDKHRAFYLVCNVQGKRRQLFIPAELEEEARQWVTNYQSAMELLEKVSERGWEELKRRKERSDT
jgi:hypothetical protein